MIITHATISMATRHHYQESHDVSERLTLAQNVSANVATRSGGRDESVTISPHAFSLNLLATQINRQQLEPDTTLDARSRMNLLILQMMFEQVMGRPLRMGIASGTGSVGEQPSGPWPANAVGIASPIASGTLVYERHEEYRESERLVFNAAGVIRTADGREINFSSSLRMSRDYYESSSLILRHDQGMRIDPLVINFDGQGAALSQTRFAFDLDSDGTTEQIAILKGGSGFLAWDRNGDGVINNGSELFGPTTGRGFAELAQYDEDGNQFIDEGDSIYAQLRIWMINEDGSSQLFALGDKQIGAIYVGHIASSFQLKDQQNRSLGEVVNSGVYLTEAGEMGIVQEINLTV